MLYSVCLHLPLPVWDYIFQQQVHGPHRSPGKRFNRYNSDKNHYLLFEELNGPLIIRTEVSFTQRCVETRLKLANWFWRRKVFNFIKCIFAISTLSFLEKRRTLHLNKLESYLNLIRGFFVLSLVEIGPVFLCQCFRFFLGLYLSLEKGMILILKNLESHLLMETLCYVWLKLTK